MIVDGTHGDSENGFYGKGLFCVSNGESYDFTKIDYSKLIAIGELAQYDANDAIEINDMEFVRVPHLGWQIGCGRLWYFR